MIKTNRASPQTIRKLAQGFGGDAGLEDYLLILAGHRHKPEQKPTYLEVIPLLSPGYQHILEVLVGEMAKVEGIEIPGEKKKWKERRR